MQRRLIPDKIYCVKLTLSFVSSSSCSRLSCFASSSVDPTSIRSGSICCIRTRIHSWLCKDQAVTHYLRASYAASRYCFWRRLCVCVSVRRKSRKLLVGNWCNLVGICLMVNARINWKLVTFDLDLWPWEFFFFFFSSVYYNLRMALPRNIIYGTEIHLKNI